MGLRGTEPELGPNSATFWRRITLGDTGAQIRLKAAYPQSGWSWALRPLLLSAITSRSPSTRRRAGICALRKFGGTMAGASDRLALGRNERRVPTHNSPQAFANAACMEPLRHHRRQRLFPTQCGHSRFLPLSAKVLQWCASGRELLAIRPGTSVNGRFKASRQLW